MNLLDILSSGKRNLSEENVSSLLAWLLDPSQSHGCGPLFLKDTLNKIDTNKFNYWLPILTPSKAFKKADKDDDVKINILVEEQVTTSEGKK